VRPSKATLICRRTKNLRAAQLLLDHSKLESTVRYLGIAVDGAVEVAEQTEIWPPLSLLLTGPDGNSPPRILVGATSDGHRPRLATPRQQTTAASRRGFSAKREIMGAWRPKPAGHVSRNRPVSQIQILRTGMLRSGHWRLHPPGHDRSFNPQKRCAFERLLSGSILKIAMLAPLAGVGGIAVTQCFPCRESAFSYRAAVSKKSIAG